MSTPISEIYDSLHSISEESGTDFLSLSESFPVLIQELEGKQNRSKIRTSSMDVFAESINALKDAIDHQTELLGTNRTFLSQIRQKNNNLFTNVSEKTNLLDSIHDIILGIKEASQEMEVISLNAMVVSIRSGKEGQAFSYITSNLKQMSLRLIKQSEDLIKSGDSVQEALQFLQNQIQGVNDLNEKTDVLTSGGDNGMMQAVDAISNKLEEIISSSKEVKHPILKAMEGIQMQDIIRQSLDDVLLAVQKVRSADSSMTPEQRMEIHTANEQLLLLCSRCIEKIKGKLDDSIAVFTGNRDEANKILTEIDKTRDAFVHADGHKTAQIERLKECMDGAVDNFNQFTALLQSYQSVQARVLDSVSSIQDSVHNMDTCFSGFLPIISTLQYVAIAQRIEVARNVAISTIKDTVEHMSELILNTKGNVDTAQKQLLEFTETCNNEIKTFLDESGHDKKTFTAVSSEKKVFQDKLSSIYDGLFDAIEHFSVYTPEFFECYRSIADRIDHLNELSKRLFAAKCDLDCIYRENITAKKSLMKQYDVADKGVQDTKIREFLEYFTITDDKLEAGSIAGIKVSGGADAGDITFF
ncbi:MAG: hypothetical protein MJ183_07615 [Treponemataceae bacterium]|nr:hypothetical protein [Treponemataceae bacterium]